MPRTSTSYTQEFDRQGARDRSVGTQAEDDYLARARGFDARKGASEAARGYFNQFGDKLNKMIRNLRGAQVGSGRLDTGFGNEDQDELIQGGIRDLNDTLATNALQAESLNLRNTEGLGGFGERTTGRYLDILGGNRDAAMMDEEARRAQEAKKKSGLFGLIGRVGGSLLGPAGGVLGNKLGNYLGGLLD